MNVEKSPAENKIIVYQFLPVYLEIKIQIISLGEPLKKGVESFNDFTDKALDEIKIWAYYIWYTGSHIMLCGDYTTIGISNDDPDVVKGGQAPPTLLRIITMLILISR
jgi:hypothetical protein